MLIVELALVILIARFLAFLLNRFRIPAMTSYMIAGLLLGPSVLNVVGTELPKDLISLTLLFLMFYAGLNVDFKGIKGYINKSLVVSISGVGLTILLIILFLTTYVGLDFLPALVVAIALANTATEVVVVMLKHSYRVNDEFRRVLITASFFDDIIVVIFMTLIKVVILKDLNIIFIELLKVMTFFSVALTTSLITVKYLQRVIYPLVINWGYFLFLSSSVFFGMVFITYRLALSEIFGAYIAGLVISILRLIHDPTLIHIIRVEDFTSHISTVLDFFIIPIFFVYVGSKILISQFTNQLTLIILALAFIGKFVGVAATSLPWRKPAQWLALGLAMNVRGSMEPAIALVALEYGILRQDLFSATVAVSLFTSMVIPAIFSLIGRVGRGLTY